MMFEQRLIDANALMEDICGSLNQMTNIGVSVDGEWLWGKLNDALEHAPTIEERKKGAWMPHPNREFREWDICTACGVGCKRRDYEDGGMTEYNYHYCPNCGADMRGDRDETN